MEATDKIRMRNRSIAQVENRTDKAEGHGEPRWLLVDIRKTLLTASASINMHREYC